MARIRVQSFTATPFTVVQLVRAALDASNTPGDQSHAEQVLDALEDVSAEAHALVLEQEKQNAFDVRKWRESAAGLLEPKFSVEIDSLAFDWVKARMEKAAIPGQWSTHARKMRTELSEAVESKRSLERAPEPAEGE